MPPPETIFSTPIFTCSVRASSDRETSCGIQCRPWTSDNRNFSGETQTASSLVLRLNEYTPSQSPLVFFRFKELNTTTGKLPQVTGDSYDTSSDGLPTCSYASLPM